MGRVEKGVNCSVSGCSESAERSISGSKASMAADLEVNTSNREYTCADSTIKNGKKQPKKTERPKGPDGANQINKQMTR